MPHQIVFVMDGAIGQAAFDQAQAFKEKVCRNFHIKKIIIIKISL
jgi:signal recognition particle GTPase